MADTVLITHASRHGGTAEIAERIQAILQAEGFSTALRPVAEVGELNGYRAVVLGTAVYMGTWCRDARRFLRSHRYGLSALPVWLFSSGPTGEGDALEQAEGRLYPQALGPVINHIHPRDIALFHGKIDPDTLSVAERWVVRTVDAETGDFREWDTIDAWAREIAGDLREALG